MKTVKIGKFHILELIISGLWISDSADVNKSQPCAELHT